MGWIIGLKHLSGWGRSPLFGRFGYVEMTRFLIIKAHLFCRLSTGARLCSVYGRLFSVWRTKTYLRRCLHGWRIRRRILLSGMGGFLELHLLRLAWAFEILS